jgi:MORN repeat variant
MSDSLPSASGGSRLLPVGMILGLIALVLIGIRIWGSRQTLQVAPSVEYSQGQTNLFTGYLVERYPGGELQSRSAISNGLMHGVSEGWYTNGVLAVREAFSEGKSHGVRTKWSMEGSLRSQATIAQGQLEGPYKEWHTNGKPSLEIHFRAGTALPNSQAWDESGSPIDHGSNPSRLSSTTRVSTQSRADISTSTP